PLPLKPQIPGPRRPALAQAATSSAPPPAESPLLLICGMEQKLTLTAPPPSSSEVILYALRAGFGTACYEDHFRARVAARGLRYQYDVSITPEVASEKINRDVIDQLVKLYKESRLGNRIPAYDGMKSIYTAGPLPFASKEFVVTLPEKDDHEDSSAAAAGSKRSREFKVTLKLSSKPDLYQLQQFLQSQQHESPQEETQVLDVALRAAPPEKYSSFATELGQKGGDLGEGQEYWRGFSQSQFGLSLNIDVSARAIYEPIMVTEFVKKLLSDRQLSRPLPDRDRLKEKKPLKGVQVSLSYEEHTSYEVTGVSVEPQSKLKFTHERYSIGLRDVAMPALQSGRDSKPAYLPMELCTIGSGKRYSRLNERQATALLRATSQSPGDRERSIYQLKYHHSGREKSENPLMGQWNMINKVWYWLMCFDGSVCMLNSSSYV
ncbi:protein argonaute 5-like, partial [Pyrus communis]|uniref:protein argonaute 5-like n=1 Tax=Pyrus communis TaxID=23211 RepID=UPI0035BF1A9F